MPASKIQFPDITKYLKAKGEKKTPLRRSAFLLRVSKMAERIEKISGTWNPVELYTPSNLQSEKKKFLASYIQKTSYNPQFRYAHVGKLRLGDSKQRLEQLQSEIGNLKDSTDRLDRILYQIFSSKIDDDLATVELVEGLIEKDETKIKRALQRKYSGTDEIVWQEAQSDLEQRIHPSKDELHGELTEHEVIWLKKKQFDAKKIKEAFEWMLEQYGILAKREGDGFKVVIDKKTTSIDVRDKITSGATIFVPADREVDGLQLLNLMAHEGEGHVRQSVNGRRLFIIFGGKLKIDDETLYEGLGLRYENLVTKKLLGYVDASPNPTYHIYAIRAAENGKSFLEIFIEQVQLHLQVALHIEKSTDLPKLDTVEEEIREHVLEESWLSTYRAMRGHIDTSNKTAFAMTKDLAYVRGLLMDTQLQKQNIGYLNESAIIPIGGLQLLAEFEFSEKDLPLPFKDVAMQYWHEVLRREMQKG